MVGNPYRVADARQRRARLRVEGPWLSRSVVAPIGAAFIALWLARDLYAGLLGPTLPTWASGLVAISARVGLVVAAGLSLSTYDTVVRGPDRGVLDLHPLLARPWLEARTLGLARSRSVWLLVALVFLAPLAARPAGLALAATVVFGSWLAGITTGLGFNLAAPGLGTRPAFAGVLDTIRGPNPRLQAALLYAPGCSVAVTGAAALAAAWGAGEVLLGRGVGWLGLLTPFLLAGGSWRLAVAHAAEKARLGAILGEVDAAWAQTESPEEARAAYLEWTVRFAPRRLRVALQKELRHLWRGHRAWVTGSWGLALLTAFAAWTETPASPPRFVPAAGLSLAVLGYVGVRLGATDPPWLDGFFRPPGVIAARAAAVWLASVWVLVAGAGALLVRRGTDGLGPLLPLLAAGLVLPAVASWAGDRLRGRGGLIYAPIAILSFALVGFR